MGQRHVAPPCARPDGGNVSDRIYLVLAGLIIALILADVLANDSTASLFLIRKLFHLVDYLEFWR
jgi:hypothetical protein